MRKLLYIIPVLLIIIFSFNVFAEDVNLNNLTPEEKALFFQLQQKSKATNYQEINKLTQGIKDFSSLTPDAINSWRQLITGTIKDIWNDLNVSVNEFIKTPAGIGISALILYKVAGKEILFTIIQKVYEIIFILPFWFFSMIVIFYAYKKMFTQILVYKKITIKEDENGKKYEIKENPERQSIYDFRTTDSRIVATICLCVYFFLANLITLVMIF